MTGSAEPTVEGIPPPTEYQDLAEAGAEAGKAARAHEAGEGEETEEPVQQDEENIDEIVASVLSTPTHAAPTAAPIAAATHRAGGNLLNTYSVSNNVPRGFVQKIEIECFFCSVSLLLHELSNPHVRILARGIA